MSGSDTRRQFDAFRKEVLIGLLSETGQAVDRPLKLALAKKLLKTPKLVSDGLDRSGLTLIAEELGGLRPASHLLALIDSLALLEECDGRWFLKDRLQLGDFKTVTLPSGFRGRPHPLAEAAWTMGEVRGVLLPKRDPSWTPRTVKQAISRGYKWLKWTLSPERQKADDEAASLPAFWQCFDGEDQPVGQLRAVTSAGDALGSVLDSALFGWSGTVLTGDDAPIINHASAGLLAFLHPPGADPADPLPAPGDWDHGGFHPHDDQPEAERPTVDATWDALLPLSGLYDSHDELTERFGGRLDIEKSRVGTAMLDAVAFLLRMQLPDGGWGIYRYPEGGGVYPYGFTTGQTLLALQVALLSDAFEDLDRATLRTETEEALREAWSFLESSRVETDGLRVWLPYYRKTDARVTPDEILATTMWTATGVLAIHRAIPDLQAATVPALNDFLAHADRHWRPDYGRALDTEFRVPRETGLNDTFCKWSNRFDLTLAIIALDLFNQSREKPETGLIFPDGLWPRLEETIDAVLDEQHHVHGHWHEPIEGMPLAAATAMAIQALQFYLSATRHILDVPYG